jgi:hypothetical protein
MDRALTQLAATLPMPLLEDIIQQTVDSLDAGDLGKWLWRGVLVAVAIGLSVFYILHEFRGLPVSQAMDQAQIGREILRGHGWQTKFIRPIAIGELRAHGKDVKSAAWQDTANAPIPPLLDAAAIYIPIQKGWNLTRTTHVYSGDRAIAIMGVFFFLASVVVLYFIAADLFDHRLAWMAVGLVIICEVFWRYSISGLPQTFLLLLLNLSVYAMLQAIRARYAREPQLWWVAAAGLGFGLMALTHALSIFIFAPVLVFSFIFFKPRGWATLVLLGVFLAVYAPWLIHNAMVCGDFRGVAWISVYDGIAHPESGHMRRFALDLKGTTGNYFAQNFRLNMTGQINRMMEYMGWCFVAPVALVSLLQKSRRPVKPTLRWLLIAMWASAACGMALFGMKEERSLAVNQFHLLFVPLFACYGLAYVLDQWDRRNETFRFGRTLLITGIFAVSSFPLVSRMFLDRNPYPFEWPPYMPSYTGVLNEWFEPKEIIGSDMPWAVAWYADRYSLWLPYDDKDLVKMSDYNDLGMPVRGLYFTPVSGTGNTLKDLLTGEYSKWSGYIDRTLDTSEGPFPYKTNLGSLECAVYADRDRHKPVVK